MCYQKYIKYKYKYINLRNTVQKAGKYVSGPISITYHTKDNKDIYLMYDKHSIVHPCNEDNSIGIQDYLENLFVNAEKHIDFF